MADARIKKYWPSQIGGALVDFLHYTYEALPSCRGAMGDFVTVNGKLVGAVCGHHKGRVEVACYV